MSAHTLDTIATYAVSFGITAALYCTIRLVRELHRLLK